VSGAGWSFGHDLVRETARLELPTADRLAVHARIGSYLQGYADAAPAVVAHQHATPERSGNVTAGTAGSDTGAGNQGRSGS
jgi:hypothetical protein